MSAPLSPIVSEFETEEQAASYDRWFREKVTSSLAKPGSGTPHDEVMARMNGIIEEAELDILAHLKEDDSYGAQAGHEALLENLKGTYREQ